MTTTMGPAETAPGPPPARQPRMRWTEHGPVPVAEVAHDEVTTADEAVEVTAADDHDSVGVAPADDTAGEVAVGHDEADGVAAIRARLAARGLVRQEPSVRIREITHAGPGPAPVVRIIPDVATDLDDEDDAIAFESGGPASVVDCPSCRRRQPVPIRATGFGCVSCAKVWRWSVCGGCDHLSLNLARQESWRCRHCGASTRSWWRTATATRDAEAIIRRRQSETADQRRARAFRALRRWRWHLVLAGVAAAVAAGGVVIVSGDDGRAAAGGPTRAVCASFDDVRTQAADARTDPAALRSSIDFLAASALDATDAVRTAAQRFAASGRPGDETFATALGDLARACAGAA